MTDVLVVLLCVSLVGNALVLGLLLRLRTASARPQGSALESGLRGELRDARREAAEAASLRRQLAELTRAAADAADTAPPPGPGADSPAVPRELPLGRDAVADSVVDGADLGPVVVRAASVRGDRHRVGKEHRRDAVRLRLLDGFGGPVLFSAVATGSPRGEWSRSGAERACEGAIDQLDHFGRAVGDRLFDPAAAAEVKRVLQLAALGVAGSIRSLARELDRTGTDGSADDAAVETGLTCLLSRLGDGVRREHLAFGVGEGAVLRLRAGAWERVHDVAGVEQGRTALLPRDAERLTWTRFESLPGDLVLVCSRPMADLLDRDDVGAWFAERWQGRRPYLTTFLSDVNVRVRSPGEDRSVVALWDYGATRSAN
ncbi:protein phosphatase 2C domain-containing protein [Streptacidiphilus cavernicola]|uniref:Protein phosphatase 2C domain-containing protein n=1 Tax=Streptacidiphilus cavernicola TaxID=3342716 RepID=A0ABV6VSG5_9ACTN